MFFYSEPDPVVEPAFDLEESFEAAEGWLEFFTFSTATLSTPEISESFESIEGWDTTIV